MSDDLLARQWAGTVGNLAERLLLQALDRAGELGLRGLEEAAAQVGGEGLKQAESRLAALRARAAPLPRQAGRLAAGATYFAVRWTPEATRSARAALTDAKAFAEGRGRVEEG
jgi:hypothetical protein